MNSATVDFKSFWPAARVIQRMRIPPVSASFKVVSLIKQNCAVSHLARMASSEKRRAPPRQWVNSLCFLDITLHYCPSSIDPSFETLSISLGVCLNIPGKRGTVFCAFRTLRERKEFESRACDKGLPHLCRPAIIFILRWYERLTSFVGKRARGVVLLVGR